MSEDVKQVFEERLGRYHAAIALEPHDRIPIATGSNYFAEVYSGNVLPQLAMDEASVKIVTRRRGEYHEHQAGRHFLRG